jgi:hypothetical protein
MQRKKLTDAQKAVFSSIIAPEDQGRFPKETTPEMVAKGDKRRGVEIAIEEKKSRDEWDLL